MAAYPCFIYGECIGHSECQFTYEELVKAMYAEDDPFRLLVAADGDPDGFEVLVADIAGHSIICHRPFYAHSDLDSHYKIVFAVTKGEDSWLLRDEAEWGYENK